MKLINKDPTLQLQNSHFPDPLFKLRWSEYEISQYNTMQ